MRSESSGREPGKVEVGSEENRNVRSKIEYNVCVNTRKTGVTMKMQGVEVVKV